MDIPDAFLCPVTKDIMKDPVIAEDGFSYERDAIVKWFLLGRKTSPITNTPLECTHIFPNRALKSAIQDFIVEQRQKLRSSLMAELEKVTVKSLHSPEECVLQIACMANAVGSDASLDTLSVLHGVLTSWKQDADVCEAAMRVLVSLMEKSDEGDIARMHRHSIFDIIMDTMRRFESLPTLQILGLKYVQLYSQTHGFVKAVSIHRYRACDIVVGSMKLHALDPRVQVEGAKAIGMLGQNFPSQLFKTGVSRVLLAATGNFVEDPEVVVAACRALLRLTSGTCARLCHMGFCRRLADAMLFAPKDQELQRVCCLALGKVCHSKVQCDEAVCDVVVTCMQEFSNVKEVTHAACVAIAKMAFWNRFATRLGDLGACEMVLVCLELALEGPEGPAEERVASATLALEALTAGNKVNSMSVSTERAGRAFLGALAAFPDHRRIVLGAIRALQHIAASSPVFATLAREEWEAPPCVIQSMRRHLGEEEIQESGWALLDTLAGALPVNALVVLSL